MKSTDIKTFHELVQRKGISSTFLKKTLSDLNSSKLTEPDWSSAKELFEECGKTAIHLVILKATFARTAIAIKRHESAEFGYLEGADNLFEKNKVENSLLDFIQDLLNALKVDLPEYSEILTVQIKECILIYSIIQNLLKDVEI